MGLEKFADFGSEEPWVARTSLGLLKISSFLVNNEQVSENIMEMFLEISAAYQSLQSLRKLRPDSPVIESDKEYSSLYSHLWIAYKEKFTQYAAAMGYKIGFIFQKQTGFDAAADFTTKLPETKIDFIEEAKSSREKWQNELGDLRNNNIQHGSMSPEIKRKYYNLETASTTFVQVWQTIEAQSVKLINDSLPANLYIEEIPEKDRDPGKPARFQITTTDL